MSPAIPAVAPNIGTKIWHFGTEVASGITRGFENVRSDAGSLRDITNFFLRTMQLLGHFLFENRSLLGAGGIALISTVGIIDAFSAIGDGGAIRTASTIFEKGAAWSFFSVDVIGFALWVGERGFHFFAGLCSCAAHTATFSVFGTALNISGNIIFGYLLVIPFGFQMASGIDEAINAKTLPQRVYGGLVAARCFVEIVVAVSAATAAVFGATTAALPAVLALGALAALIAVGAYLYKQGNLADFA